MGGGFGPLLLNMQIIVTNKDEFLNQIARPGEIQKYIPDYGKRMDYLAEYRKYTDDLAKTTSYGRIAGGSGNLKLIARIPESLLIGIMAIEPDFLKDKKNIYKWLDANPEYAAYTRKKRTK